MMQTAGESAVLFSRLFALLCSSFHRASSTPRRDGDLGKLHAPTSESANMHHVLVLISIPISQSQRFALSQSAHGLDGGDSFNGDGDGNGGGGKKNATRRESHKKASKPSARPQHAQVCLRACAAGHQPSTSLAVL
jgi:hypothetical protein